MAIHNDPYTPHLFDKVPIGDWQARGACNKFDRDLWFPESHATHHASQAKAICKTCPVRQECLDFAMAEPMERFGIWGGTSLRDRQKLKNQQTDQQRRTD